MLLFTEAFNGYAWTIFVVPAALLLLHVLEEKKIL